ncbi:hypothetical protein NM962_09735 [Mycobacterium sp. SVM_VP21]|nr:hypothetical protein NM962_09735 [Mycobacterium sp. SVM_VP21]
MMTDHDPIGYELTDLGADPDSHLYPVDSATRTCCGGIGGHTRSCATDEADTARALRRHADSILMAATSAENAAADVALTPANARLLAGVLLAAALVINDGAVTR